MVNVTGNFGTTTTGTATVQIRDPENNLVDLPNTASIDTANLFPFFLDFPIASRNSISVALVGGTGTVALVVVIQGDIVGG